jgi:NAD(P)-dependent dehydrogenase (short-subunit alcohol dehydrogenase family)
MKWTAADIPSQSGRTAIVTGANSGLGRAVARELWRAGADVVLACRDLSKGAAVAAEIGALAPRAGLEVSELDLAALASVRDFSERFARTHRRLDLLVNNAGVMAAPHRRTADGFELQLGTNHLGHFALTGRLLPLLREREEARVVTVSSGVHHGASLDFDDLQGERHYARWGAYGQSKLANLLFALELDRRLRSAGLPLISVAAHPGYAATNLQFSGPPPYERVFMAVGNLLIAQRAEMGALPILYAATAPGLAGGSYVGPDGLFEGRGHPRLVSPSSAARDQPTADRLWGVSERLTGVVYDFGQSSV